MSDMNLEKAKEIFRKGNPPFVNDRFEYMRAAGFIEGHALGYASRDQEVAKWIEDRDNWIKRFEGLQKELSAERETVEKLKADVREWLCSTCTPSPSPSVDIRKDPLGAFATLSVVGMMREEIKRLEAERDNYKGQIDQLRGGAI